MTDFEDISEFKALKEEPKDEDITAKYRAVFLNGYGSQVLEDLLDMCHFFEILDGDNKYMMGEYNLGIGILAKLGILNPQSKKEVIRALCSIIPKPKKEVIGT